MNEFEEITVLRKDFPSTTDSVRFDIPGQTVNLQRLELKELKIQLDAGVVLTDVPYIELDIFNASGGLVPASRPLILTPSVQTVGGVNYLYAQYRGNNVILLKQNSVKTTLASKPISLQFRDANQKILAKVFVYLRMGLVEGDADKDQSREFEQSTFSGSYQLRSKLAPEFFALPHVDRFQAL